MASAILGSNGEVQQLPSRLPSAEPQSQSQSQPLTGRSAGTPQRSLSPQPGPQPLAWLPATSAALALRLYALDAALLYSADSAPARDSLQVRLLNTWKGRRAQCGAHKWHEIVGREARMSA